ncbi:1142_t:CDS:1, partial [Diversispora eburnea]
MQHYATIVTLQQIVATRHGISIEISVGISVEVSVGISVEVSVR